MAHYAVEIDGIDGDETLTDYADQITCSSMMYGMDLPVVAKGADRTDGASMHGIVVLAKEVDKASPLLREACVKSKNIPLVNITRIKMSGTTVQAADITSLGTAKIIKVYLETPVDPSTGEPADQPMEFFEIDYEEIQWVHKVYSDGNRVDTISGSYDTATMSKTTSIPAPSTT